MDKLMRSTTVFLILVLVGSVLFAPSQNPAGGYSAGFGGGGGGAGGGSSITLQTNGVNNGSQSNLNLANGANIAITDNGTGSDTIAVTGLAVAPANTPAVTGKVLQAYNQSTGVFTQGFLQTICSPQFSTTDTITSATSPTETVFATTCAIPANTLAPNIAISGTVTIDWTATATVPNTTFKVKLCTVSGCGSGTVKDVYTGTTTAAAAGTFSASMPFVIQGASALGATATLASGFAASVGANTPFGRNTLSSSLGNMPTNSQLFLSFSIAFSTNAASNSMTLTSLVMNPGPLA